MVSSSKKRFLLGQLAARGDCLYATAVARQIKTNFPDCHLTWAIGSMCKGILENNPYVDEIWEIPLTNHAEVEPVWKRFEQEALEKKKLGIFDDVFFTQISPNNFQNFDGTVRSSIFRGYPYAMTVPVSPVIRLSEREVENVRSFVLTHKLKDYSHVILFEYSSYSGQSFVTPDFALECSQQIVDGIKNSCVILSSNVPVSSPCAQIIDGSSLSFRENAELANYCSLLIGCSSGLSWLCTSDWVKPLSIIQLLRKKTSVYASMVHDFEHFGLSTDLIMEMTECKSQKLFECVKTIIDKDFIHAKQKFHEKIPVKFDFYIELMHTTMAKKQFKKACISMCVTLKRYGLRANFFQALARRVYNLTYYYVIDNSVIIRKKMYKKLKLKR